MWPACSSAVTNFSSNQPEADTADADTYPGLKVEQLACILGLAPDKTRREQLHRTRNSQKRKLP